MASKKLRFRGDLNFQNRIDDLYDDVVDGAAVGGFNHRRSSGSVNTTNNSKETNDTTTKITKESETEERGK